MKNKLKGYLRVVSFILVFVIIISVSSFTVFSKAEARKFSNKYGRFYACFDEKPESIQIAALGNSDLYSGFCPFVLWNDFGYTSSLISNPHMDVISGYYLFRQFCVSQKPDILIIETDMLFEGVPRRKSVSPKRKQKEMNRLQKKSVFDYLTGAAVERYIPERFGIFEVHDKWKTGFGADFSKNAYSTNNLHGYYFSDYCYPIEEEDYMADNGHISVIKPLYISYLEKIIGFAREQGTDVILAEFPSVCSWNHSRSVAVSELAESENIGFIDFNIPGKYIDVDFSADFRDDGNHVNHAGATKITRFLGDYIKNNQNVKNKASDPSYSYWNDDYEEFIRFTETYGNK